MGYGFAVFYALPTRCARVALLCVPLALAACASGGIFDKSLEIVGLMKKPEVPPEVEAELAKIQARRQVTLRMHAGQNLNSDANGRGLSLVTRIYMLRATSQFSQAGYAAFASADRAAFADEVVSTKEVVLTPGQKYEVVETLAPEATHLAVVALFRSPDALRWRYVFDAKAAAKSGVTIGLHGCALSVSSGEPVNVPPDAQRLAGVRCR